MKYFLLTFFFLALSSQNCNAQFFNRLKNAVKDAAEDHVENDVRNATNKTIDKAESKAKKGNKDQSSSDDSSAPTANEGTTSDSETASAPTIKSYQNYDFVPGDTIIIADDFSEDQNGEFPAHWTLTKGQAVVNQVAGKPTFCLTQGNYCQVYPRMKTDHYLTDNFTVEFDYYANSGHGPSVSFNFISEEGYSTEGYLEFGNRGEVSTFELPADFSADYPNEDDATFRNKWHHAAIIYKKGTVKCYIDQYRILVIPDFIIQPYSLGFAGIGDVDNPIMFANVRVAKGGNMNMIGKKFTDSKIVTHGITFDVDKSDLKPESMGTINIIYHLLQGDSSLKFEIDGHTDNSGDAVHNLALSQQRAEAVKAQLVKMGIASNRLTTKGFGDTKPISDNATPEGKANNRRVEFIRQ